jgi:FlaA1/EpsC-like NDP-sugar epimerase
MEKNILAGIRNNVFGTLVLAESAIETNVPNVLLISTDKAVNPSSYMGASKRISEQICQSLDKIQDDTKISIVRFGNVLGSSGSVIPLFKKQIENGGPITLTHPNMSRYFMTIPEAAQLVVQSTALARGGEVFVLDMGEPIKIIDLAQKMIRLSGFTPFIDGNRMQGDIAVSITGLRPGEKMHEELSYQNNLSKTLHPRIMNAPEKPLPITEMQNFLKIIESAISDNDYDKISSIINKMTGSSLRPKNDK